jgi:hypothetical protein
VLQGTVCVEGPEHGAPLPWGGGLVQVRVWLRVPPPHDAVHEVMLAQADQLPSAGAAGHSCVLQGTVCVEGPEHGAPLPWGAGLVQVRVWLRVPPPHDAVHAVILAQADQLPSAAGSVSMQG